MICCFHKWPHGIPPISRPNQIALWAVLISWRSVCYQMGHHWQFKSPGNRQIGKATRALSSNPLINYKVNIIDGNHNKHASIISLYWSINITNTDISKINEVPGNVNCRDNHCQRLNDGDTNNKMHDNDKTHGLLERYWIKLITGSICFYQIK